MIEEGGVCTMTSISSVIDKMVNSLQEESLDYHLVSHTAGISFCQVIKILHTAYRSIADYSTCRCGYN